MLGTQDRIAWIRTLTATALHGNSRSISGVLLVDVLDLSELFIITSLTKVFSGNTKSTSLAQRYPQGNFSNSAHYSQKLIFQSE